MKFTNFLKNNFSESALTKILNTSNLVTYTSFLALLVVSFISFFNITLLPIMLSIAVVYVIAGVLSRSIDKTLISYDDIKNTAKG